MMYLTLGTSALHEQMVQAPMFPVSTTHSLSLNLYVFKKREKMHAWFMEGFYAKDFTHI